MIRRISSLLLLSAVFLVQAHDDMTCTMYRHPNANLVVCKGDNFVSVELEKYTNKPKAHLLVIKAVKKLAKTIPADQAAFLYVKKYKQAMDGMLEILPDYAEKITQATSPCDIITAQTEFIRDAMQAISDIQLDLSVLQYSLPKWIVADCNATVMMSIQSSAMQFIQSLNSVNFCDKDALAQAFTDYMTDMLLGCVDALATVLGQHYDLGRAALGIEQHVVQECFESCNQYDLILE